MLLIAWIPVPTNLFHCCWCSCFQATTRVAKTDGVIRQLLAFLKMTENARKRHVSKKKTSLCSAVVLILRTLWQWRIRPWCTPFIYKTNKTGGNSIVPNFSSPYVAYLMLDWQVDDTKTSRNNYTDHKPRWASNLQSTRALSARCNAGFTPEVTLNCSDTSPEMRAFHIPKTHTQAHVSLGSGWCVRERARQEILAPRRAPEKLVHSTCRPHKLLFASLHQCLLSSKSKAPVEKKKRTSTTHVWRRCVLLKRNSQHARQEDYTGRSCLHSNNKGPCA